MVIKSLRAWRYLGFAALAAAALSGCGGGDSASSTPKLSGVAAVGAPITGGSISVKCSGGSASTTTSATTGAWTVSTSGLTLPCAVQVTGGYIGTGTTTPNTGTYHSVALTVGTVNVTPLTDMAMAQMLGAAPATWFGSPTFTAVSSTALTTALNTVNTNLGLNLGSTNPFTATFTAKAGDTIDNILEAIKSTLTNQSKTYADLLAAAQANNYTSVSGFGSAFGTIYGNLGGGSTSGATSCSSTELLMVYDGTTSKYTKGQGVCFNAGASSLNFLTKTLTNPVANRGNPYSTFTFTDPSDSYVYEVVFNVGDIYEINVSKGPASTDFVGQFTPSTAGAGAGTLTIDTTVAGTTASIVVKGVTKPSTQTEFCSFAQNDKSTTALNSTGGTLTINSCTFSGNVGNISATVAITSPISFSTSYTIKYTYN